MSDVIIGTPISSSGSSAIPDDAIMRLDTAQEVAAVKRFDNSALVVRSLTPADTVFQSAATANQIVTFPDESGTVSLDGHTHDDRYYTETEVDAALASLSASKQPLDATLTALAGVTVAANKLIYATGADAFTTADLTAAGRALLDDANAAAQLTTLGIGNVENTAVSTWAGTTNITTLGTITVGVWSGTAVAVAKGGTGATDAGTARSNLGVDMSFTVNFLTTTTGQASWNSQPSADTKMFGVNSVRRRVQIPAWVTQFRVLVGWGSTGNAGAKVYAKYSTDDGANFTRMETGAGTTGDAVYAASTETKGSWVNIDSSAIGADMLIGIFGSGGNASTALTFFHLEVQFK